MHRQSQPEETEHVAKATFESGSGSDEFCWHTWPPQNAFAVPTENFLFLIDKAPGVVPQLASAEGARVEFLRPR